MVAPNEPKPQHTPPLVPLGRCYATPGAVDALAEAATDAGGLLRRHRAGDWGTVCPEDRRANEAAVQDGGRVLSAYVLATGVKVWVITEADRSVTTVLLPDEY